MINILDKVHGVKNYFKEHLKCTIGGLAVGLIVGILL
tara:strand:- start:422 stop:532 length:111 start_codon:yes stop_codon:yes gene_type:complete